MKDNEKLDCFAKEKRKDKNELNQNTLEQDFDDLDLKEKEKLLYNPKENNLNINFHDFNNEVNQHTHSHPQFDINFYVKLAIAIAGLTTIFLNTLFGFLFPHGNVECMEDRLFNASKPINDYFRENLIYRNGLLIVSSMCIDLSLIYTLTIWVLYGKSYRFLVSLCLFYGLRSLIQVYIYFMNVDKNIQQYYFCIL